jgi:hypothetical protein
MHTEAPLSSSRTILGLVVVQGYYNSIHGTAVRFASQDVNLQQEVSICGEEGKVDAAQENASFWRGGGSFWRARLGSERSKHAEGKVLAGEGGGAWDPV